MALLGFCWRCHDLSWLEINRGSSSPILLVLHDLFIELEFPLAGCGAAWLARRSGGPKVGGSNPLSPTD